MKKNSILVFLFFVLVSCTKNPDVLTEYNLADNGVYIINEGNFLGGTGSVSFYSYNTGKVYNNLFQDINGWPLGDVAFSMAIKGDMGYIVVNNSGKIEVVNMNSLKSVKTIDGLISPRCIAFADNNKAFVTSMYSDSLAIINLNDNTVSGHINLRRYSESIIISGNMAFISNMLGPNYSSGHEIMVVNTITNEVVDSIAVGFEPESMALDKNNMLWVLCNGGYAREHFADLVKINTGTYAIETEFVFPLITDSPTSLIMDGTGENMYFLERGVRKMNISSSQLPDQTLIPESDQYFYKLGINPVNNDIFITDAKDYQQKGNVIIYKNDGTLVSTLTADIIPAFMCFKLDENFQSE